MRDALGGFADARTILPASPLRGAAQALDYRPTTGRIVEVLETPLERPATDIGGPYVDTRFVGSAANTIARKGE